MFRSLCSKRGEGEGDGEEERERRGKGTRCSSRPHSPLPSPALLGQPRTHHSAETILTRSWKITSFWLNSVAKTWFFFDFLVAFDVIKCSLLLEALSRGFCEVLKPTSQTSGWVLGTCPLLPRGHSTGFHPNHSPLLILQAQPPLSSSYSP